MAEEIDVRQLRAFTALMQEGSFTGAAKRIGVTQSAVSHALKQLQSDLGCRIFYKEGRRIHLTRHGRALLEKAEKIFYELDQVMPSMRALDDADRGTLRMGSTVSASQFFLPGVLREFRECFPAYTIAVEPGDTRGLVARLREGLLDIVLALHPPEDAGLGVKPILRDELVFLVNSLHPWAATGAASRKSLAGQTYIVNPQGSLTHSLVQDYFLEQGVRPRSIIELASIEAMKELVKLGVGVGVAAPWVATTEISVGSIRRIPLRPKIRREWAALWLRSRPLNLAEETFVGLCEAVGQNLQPDY